MFFGVFYIPLHICSKKNICVCEVCEVWQVQTQNDAEIVFHMIVTSLPDYLNLSLLAPLKKKKNHWENEGLMSDANRRDHVRSLLVSLWWLPVSFWADFKVLHLIYKALYNQAVSFITDCLSFHLSARTLTSSSAFILEVPEASHKKCVEAREYQVGWWWLITCFVTELWLTCRITERVGGGISPGWQPSPRVSQEPRRRTVGGPSDGPARPQRTTQSNPPSQRLNGTTPTIPNLQFTATDWTQRSRCF